MLWAASLSIAWARLPGLGDLKLPPVKPKGGKGAAGDQAPTEKSKLPSYTGPKKRLAVMDMEVKITASASAEPTTTGGVVSTTTINIPPPTDFGTGLTEMLTTALVDSGRFILLERKALADIQAEQQLAQSGAMEESSAPAKGKLLGAQALVRGAVTEYAYRRSSTGGTASFLQGIGVGTSRAEAAVVLDIRLYSSVTGQILDSAKAEGRAASSAVSLDVNREDYKMSASGFSQTPLGQASRQAIERAVAGIIARMEQVPWEGRIAALDTADAGTVTTIYINAGKAAGLKEGDRFEILRPGRDIIDPETKLVIGRAKDKLLGACVIESLTSDLSSATPVEGQGFQVGDVVRFASAKPPTPQAPAPASSGSQ